MGNKQIIIKDNDITADNFEYKGTPGLWDPNNPNNYTDEDKEKYWHLILQTNTIYRNNNPNSKYPKSSRSLKWYNIIKPVWEEIKEQTEEETEEETEGEGLTILPSDPNALIDRLDLLLSSQNAGHTGVRNELVSIFDELKRQGVINTNTYKILNSIIKK